ncbi:hypothetical protein PMIN06_009590 [Paraphaeosphaeria minitans]
MNVATLAKTSDLFKYKLYHSTQPSVSPASGTKDNPPGADNPPSSQLSDTLMPSTPILPTLPIVRLDTTHTALFLYCRSAIAPPESLSMYLDSRIPRPSYEFTIYLYKAFLLALELKDATFFRHIVSVILKDAEAGWPGDAEIAWVYENTGTGCLLREFVVNCTLAWAHETVVGKWKAWLGRTPKEFAVDGSGRMMELGLTVWWVESDVATKYTV